MKSKYINFYHNFGPLILLIATIVLAVDIGIIINLFSSKSPSSIPEETTVEITTENTPETTVPTILGDRTVSDIRGVVQITIEDKHIKFNIPAANMIISMNIKLTEMKVTNLGDSYTVLFTPASGGEQVWVWLTADDYKKFEEWIIAESVD